MCSQVDGSEGHIIAFRASVAAADASGRLFGEVLMELGNGTQSFFICLSVVDHLDSNDLPTSFLSNNVTNQLDSTGAQCVHTGHTKSKATWVRISAKLAIMVIRVIMHGKLAQSWLLYKLTYAMSDVRHSLPPARRLLSAGHKRTLSLIQCEIYLRHVHHSQSHKS